MSGWLAAAFGDVQDDLVSAARRRERAQPSDVAVAAAGAKSWLSDTAWPWVKDHKGTLLLLGGAAVVVYMVMAEEGGDLSAFAPLDGDEPDMLFRRRLKQLRTRSRSRARAGISDATWESATRVRKARRMDRFDADVKRLKSKKRPPKSRVI